MVDLNLPSSAPSVQADSQVGDRQQLSSDQLGQTELCEGWLPGGITRDVGDVPHIERQHQVILDILEDQIVAHNGDVGDDLVDETLYIARRRCLFLLLSLPFFLLLGFVLAQN